MRFNGLTVEFDEEQNLIGKAPRGHRFQENGRHTLVVERKLFFADSKDTLDALRQNRGRLGTEPCNCPGCLKQRRYGLTPDALKKMMRSNRVSILALANRLGVTMKLVRLYRKEGISDGNTAKHWIEAINGGGQGKA